MIKVDQDALCEYCVDEYDTNRYTCEGSKCTAAKAGYLQDNIILGEHSEAKAFERLRIGDQVYVISEHGKIPSLLPEKVISIYQNSSDSIDISTHNRSMELNHEFKKTNKYNLIFLNEKDACQKLEEICVERIVQLSKVIGKI